MVENPVGCGLFIGNAIIVLILNRLKFGVGFRCAQEIVHISTLSKAMVLGFSVFFFLFTGLHDRPSGA